MRKGSRSWLRLVDDVREKGSRYCMRLQKIKTYFVLFCVWVCFCGLSPFFLVIVFFSLSFVGFFVVLFVWAITYPSFSCPLINDRNKIQEWVGERFVFFCFRRVLSSDWKSEVNF